MDNIHLDEISTICSKYSGYGYYVEDRIPDKLLFTAFKALNIPVDEHIIAFLDSTITGSGKKGLAIATSGVYWRNGWTTYSLHRYHKWDQFAQVEIYPRGVSGVALGAGCVFDMTGCHYDRDRLVRMLQHVQHYVINVFRLAEYGFVDDAPATEKGAKHKEDVGSDWWVAIEGQQYGPYNLHVVQQFANHEQFRPEEAYVWKPGMPDWVPFMEQPETAALVARNK